MPLALSLLALAVFAMGTSEFMLAGLLPGLAADLDVGIGTAGLLTSAYALGMVIGAPLMAILARRWPRRAALSAFLLGFLLCHAVGAVTGHFAVLFATRAIAAVANAGFLAVAMSTAVTLVPEHRKGRALSILLAGTTVATIAGVPGGALLGAALGWRATFWAIVVLCLPALAGVLLAGLGHTSRDPRGNGGPVGLGAEVAQLRRPVLILLLVVAALINAATFGGFTFLAPLVTDVAGLDPRWVAGALMIFGLGSLAGVTVAGRLADRRPGLVIATGGPALLAGWAALALTADRAVLLLPLLLLLGALSFAVGSTLITRILYAAAGAPTLAGAYATATFNAGAAIGPMLAATTLGSPLAERGPAWMSAGLVGAALLALLSASRSALATAQTSPGRSCCSRGRDRSCRHRDSHSSPS